MNRSYLTQQNYGNSTNPCAGLCCCLLAVLVLFSLMMALTYYSPSEFAENIVKLAKKNSGLSDYELHAEFNKFMSQYGKTYATATEKETRFEIFSVNYARIVKSNLENKHFTLGVNQFADLTDDEFARLYLKKINENFSTERDFEAHLTTAGETIDYEDKLTDAKDQGNCGSCWSFGALGSIEGAYSIKHGKKIRFAEQQLVDCSIPYDNHGCNGGEYRFAWAYIKNTSEPGIILEEEYPYRAFDQKCQLKSTAKGYHILDFKLLPPASPDMIMEVLKSQPLSVSIQANCYFFRFYKGGVVTKDCGEELDHDVTLVGAGEQDGVPYWKIRNSWGKNWGLNGHILVARTNLHAGNGTFGMQATPGYPIAS